MEDLTEPASDAGNSSAGEREAAPDGVVGPWARGGSMSDPELVWFAPAKRDSSDPGAESSSGTADPEAASRWGLSQRRVALLTVVVAVGVVIWVGRTPGRGGDLALETTIASGASTAMPSVQGDVPASVDSVAGVTTSVGTIRWERIDGNQMTLPVRVVGASGLGLLGSDDDEQVGWVSTDGRVWDRDDAAGIAEVGGRRWVTRVVDGRVYLMDVSDGGEAPVEIAADPGVVRDGFVESFEVPSSSTGGLPMMLGTDMFVRLDRRIEIPWARVLSLGAGADYRVRVSDGQDSVTFASPDATRDIVDLDIRAVDAGRAELVNDNQVVWSFDLAGFDPIDAMNPAVQPGWFRWDGRRFVEIESPWSTTVGVDVIPVDGSAIAVPTLGGDDDGGLWRTTDGTTWMTVDLPVQRAPRGPMPVRTRDREVVLSIPTVNGGTSNWSTTDGVSFDELADVPGIAQRSRGSFGWIAPDPRSSPRIRVSPDGTTWQTVDLSDLLGVDSSYWNLTIHADAIESSIYVTAQRDDARVLIIGDVTSGG